MKKLIIAILSVLLLAAFIPARWSTTSIVHSDTTWKPYIVVLRNEYGQQTSKWVKGYYNPNLHGDTVATGKVAKFNFTNAVNNVAGWNDCVYADSASFTPVTDANTGFKIGVYSPSSWATTHGANNGYIPNDGGGYAFPDTVVNSLWYNFMTVGAGNSFVPNMFLSGLDTAKLYKIQFLSSTWGNGGGDTIANYATIIFQNGPLNTDTLNYGYDSVAFHNTSKTITTTYIKPQGAKINMQMGATGNPYSVYGEVNGMIVTEYKVDQ